MKISNQRGELSLIWVAIGMACFALVAMAGLMKMRYDRNLFVEIWNGLVRTTGSAETIERSQKAVEAAKNALQSGGAAGSGAGPGALRKCMIDGKVVYSNVDCRSDNATSKTVDVHDNRGFEAPKLPPPPKEDSSPQAMQEKAMEKAMH